MNSAEDAARWTRRMAEIDPFVKAIDFRLMRGGYVLFCRSTWNGHFQRVPDYCDNLNALQRVAVKLCKSRGGQRVLNISLTVAYNFFAESKEWFANPMLSTEWQACLPAAELFPILGRAIDQMDKEKGNG